MCPCYSVACLLVRKAHLAVVREGGRGQHEPTFKPKKCVLERQASPTPVLYFNGTSRRVRGLITDITAQQLAAPTGLEPRSRG